MKKVAIISVMVLVISFFGLAITMMVSGESVTDVFLGKRETVEETKSFNSQDIQRINLDVSSATINVLPTNSSKIKVEYYGKVSALEKKSGGFEIKREGNQLLIRKIQFSSFLAWDINSENDINLYLPKKTFEEVLIDVSAAKLNVEKLNVKQLDIETSAGKIDLKDISSDQTTIESSAGAVDIDKISGDLDIETSAGKVVISLDELQQNIDVSTSAGEVEINTNKVPTNMQIDYKASAGSGDINFPMSFEEKSHNRIKGVVGEGKYKVHVRTSAGSFDFNVKE